MLSSVFPFFINPDQLNWGGKVMFLFVGAEVFIMAGLYFFQPETKVRLRREIESLEHQLTVSQNRTYTDLEKLYAAGVPPRKFSRFAVVHGEVVEKEGQPGFLSRFSRKA